MLFRRLDPQLEPARAFDILFRAEPAAFWLDDAAGRGRSVMGAAAAGASVVEEDADGTVRLRDPRTAVESAGAAPESLGIEGVLRARLAEADRGPGSAADGLFPGWYGWFGYEWGARRAGVPTVTSRYPDAALMFVDRGLVFDHRDGTVTAYSSVQDAAGARTAQSWLDRLDHVLGREQRLALDAPVAGRPVTDWEWRHDDNEYLGLIESCREAIAHGDAYQLCLTNELRTSVRPDPFDSYLRLRALSPTDRSGFVRIGEVALLSASPELFLEVENGRITTRPIKGTRPRGIDERADAALAAELGASSKEQAENIMIVDVMRNDLGRVAALGTVAVSALLEVESYAQVHQLVSTVTGRLGRGVDAIDALVAAFPAGSMTGAPKRRAMQLLQEFEAGPRGVYSGCFGRLGNDGSAALAMVIRSIVIAPSGVSIGAGGGITALSDPADELDEVKLKAGALMAAVGGNV